MSFKPFVILLLFIIGSVNVFAFESLFDDYVYTLDTFQVEEDIYYVHSLANDNDVMVLKKNEFEVFYVYNGTCKDEAFYQYCFMGTKLDYNDYGRQIPNSVSWEPAIKLQIFSKKPSVTVSRDVEGEINRDDKTKVTITITNDGELDIHDLVFEEIIPSNAIIHSLGSGLQEVNNKISWARPILLKDDSISFIYTLKPTNYGSIILANGSLEYDYENSEFIESVSSSTISINSPFSAQTSVDNSDVGVGEVFTYTFTITNDDWDDRLTVDLTFSKPEEVMIVELPSDLKKENTIITDLSLEPGESSTISIKMKSNLDGLFRISSDSVMSIRDETYQENNLFNISVTIPKLVPEIKVSKSEVLEGNPFTVSAFIENPAEVSFYDLTGTITSSFFQTKNLALQGITPGDKVKLFEESFKAIPVDADETHNISFNGRYRSPNYQFFKFNSDTNIKITPVTIGFEIEKSFSQSDVFPGDEITVTVRAKNLGQIISSVKLEEDIPSLFEVSGGLTEKTLVLGVGAEEDYYIYKLRIPLETEQGIYPIKTHLNFEDLVTQTKELNLTVREKVDTSLSDINLEDLSDDEEVVEEKKGFFKSVIDFFLDLFR